MSSYDISGIELEGDHYEVVQSLIRKKYKALDEDGNVILRGKQKMLKLKEEFPFTDDEGNPVMTVKAGGVVDVAGDYMLIDDKTEDNVVMLDKHYSQFIHKMSVRDPDTEELLARIESENKLVMFLRKVSDVAKLLPHSYEIMDKDGNVVGKIEGQFSLKDKYTIDVSDMDDSHPREAIIASAMVLDAIEGN